MLNIQQLMRDLALVRPVFHSELDFHFQLAWVIQQTYPKARVIPIYKPQSVVREYLDLFIDRGDAVAMIELKYKTRLPNPPLPNFDLTSQSAHPEGRYLAWRDVVRLERWVSGWKSPATGYAIFLTNDSAYWKDTGSSKYDGDFRMHQGRTVRGTLSWTKTPQWLSQEPRPSLTLQSAYPCQWQDYSDLSQRHGAGTRRQFRYLVQEVVPQTLVKPWNAD